jgi:hypothetical protein
MGWVVNATPRPLYPLERPGTHCIGGWVGPKTVLVGAENLAPTEFRSPDRPARRESLYHLSYPGPESWSTFLKLVTSITAHFPPNYKSHLFTAYRFNTNVHSPYN